MCIFLLTVAANHFRKRLCHCPVGDTTVDRRCVSPRTGKAERGERKADSAVKQEGAGAGRFV